MLDTAYTDHDPIVRAEIAAHGLWPAAYRGSRFNRRVDRAQLARERAEAIALLPAEAREALPWQYGRDAQEPAPPYHRSRPMPAREVREIVREHRRMTGWFRAAAGSKLLCALIRKTQSPRGKCSPYTQCDLAAIAAHWSPGGLARWLGKVRRRANLVLAPYGLRVSWRALGITAEYAARTAAQGARDVDSRPEG